MSAVQSQLRAYYDNEMRDRAGRPLGPDRERHLRSFLEDCRQRGVRSVIEVGCGAGRDGVLIQAAGLRYSGADLSPVAIEICKSDGLDAREALATDLPFPDSSFDAGWSMSTLMHLDGDGMQDALAEIRRVVRPGGLVEIGVWGNTNEGEWTDTGGRYFRRRSDESLRHLLEEHLGTVDDFETWDWFADGSHYQWARVTTPNVGGTSSHSPS